MKRFLKFRIDNETRDRYAEFELKKDDLVYPLFVVGGKKIRKEIKNFYNVYHFSVDELLKEIEFLEKSKINKILLFGVIDKRYKDNIGTYAFSEDNNVIINAIKEIKKRFKNILIFTDVCLCGYTIHGHCGIIKNGKIDNNLTIKYLGKIAVNFAKHGADFVAPSAMMDGQVKEIRKQLDENGYKQVKIMSYSAKYASNFYGPFRIAARSSPVFGDRKSYQMDFRNLKQALEEIKEDIREGADIVMVKPGNLYADVIYAAKKQFKNIPIAAYQVSGEYMMIKLLAKNGLINELDGFFESLICLKRAGADYIISYYAKEIAKWLKN